ncbi:MAG: PAS domain S-box protein [Proteobacteria bacterium]|nr:PAS domain S-box protein [Pseudomonadota bacterium]
METKLLFEIRRDADRKRRILLLEEKLQEEKSIVEALQDSEKQYRRLFESAKDGILILNADTGKVVDANPFLLDLLGYSYDTVYGKHIWELGVFKDIAASKDAFRTLQDNQYIRYEDLPLVTIKGKRIAVEFVSNVYLVDNNKVIQCNIRDITARKGAERALGENEAKMKSILDNIGIGVALISPRMEILEVNMRMREWFPAIDTGKRPICYRTLKKLPEKDVCDNCPSAKTLKDGAVHEITMQIPHANGMRTYRIVSSPMRNASGEITAAVEMFEDITEKLSLESQLQQAQKMESLGRLAGGVAHDYNNMLSVIIGYAELALNKVDSSESIHDDLQEILKAAQRSKDITRQLLAFARKQIIVPRLIDLNDTIEGLLKMLRPLVSENMDLAWLPGKGLRPIMMDPSQLDQILTNLCVNAQDAITDVGKITIKTEKVTFDKTYCNDHEVFTPGDFVLLAVSDNGSGMDKEIKDNLFEPFFTTKEVGQGTGLGLSTVYGIVKQNEGFIKVLSELGKGTTFKIYLKYYEGEAIDVREEPTAKMMTGHGETILVVEDEIGVLKSTRTILKMLGYEVLTASTTSEAMQLAKAHVGEIRLVITDVVMPQMNGRELAEHMISLEPNLNILFMSGYTSNEIAHLGILDKGVCFIEKPFSMKGLATKVHEIIGQKFKNHNDGGQIRRIK